MDAGTSNVVPLESAHLKRLAKRYVADYLDSGGNTVFCVMRLNHLFTPELIRTIKDEFRKQGINW